MSSVRKKPNLFSQKDSDQLKRQIEEAINYLLSFELKDLDDDTEVKSVNSKMVEYIVSTIESKVKTVIITASDTSQILSALSEDSKHQEFIEKSCKKIIKKVDEFNTYYENMPIDKIQHRFKYIETLSKKGDVYQVKLEAATREQQIKSRSEAIKKLTQIKVTLNRIYNNEEEREDVRAGQHVPVFMR